MIKVYLYDSDGNYTGYKEVYPDYQPKQWETLVKPDLSLYNLKFNGTSWSGLTYEEWQATQSKDTEEEASKNDMILANLLKQNAKLTLVQAKMQKQIDNQQVQIEKLQNN